MQFANRQSLTLVVLLALVGCSQPAKTASQGTSGKSKEPAKVYVGTLGKGAEKPRIGIIVQGEKLLAYSCGSEETFNLRNCRWLTGKVSPEGMGEAVLDGGPKLSVRTSADKAEGTFTTAAGKEIGFDIAAAPAASNTGVYRIKFPTGNTLGWIVDPTGFVGGAEIKGKDGISLGFWKSTPGVELSQDEQLGMMALSYRDSVISSKEIERVLSP